MDCINVSFLVMISEVQFVKMLILGETDWRVRGTYLYRLFFFCNFLCIYNYLEIKILLKKQKEWLRSPRSSIFWFNLLYEKTKLSWPLFSSHESLVNKTLEEKDRKDWDSRRVCSPLFFHSNNSERKMEEGTLG